MNVDREGRRRVSGRYLLIILFVQNAKKGIITMARFSFVLLALTLGGATNAFVPQVRSVSQTALHSAPPTVTTDAERKSYAEVSRSYRRTVFTHDDWVRHRQSDRFARSLGNYFNSGVYKNIMREVSVVTIIASFVVVANCLLGDYVGLDGAKHAGILSDLGTGKLGLPMTPFTLASPSLGLLLGTSRFVACRW